MRIGAILAMSPILGGHAGVRDMRPILGRAPRAAPIEARINDQRAPAGQLVDGGFRIALDLTRATWRPDGPNGVAIDVAAIAERGQAPSIPGPLIRVPAGTPVEATVRNLLDSVAVVRGLRDHDGGNDSLVLAPGAEQVVRFVASRAGTHLYFARTTRSTALLSRRDDSQLVGALIVVPLAPRATRPERLWVITAWDDSARNPLSPYGPRQVYAINGASWPSTERLAYTVGDSVHWRVLNASQHSHPMHLHGVFFRVQSRGTAVADTLYAPAQERLAVTEYLAPGTSMAMSWKAERGGNWLYHCHTINHIDEALRLSGHTSGASHAHVDDAMAGLVLAITVNGGRTTTTWPRPIARLRLHITERAQPAGSPALAYVLQRDARAPAADSLEAPGSTLVLHQGEPTEITVLNRTRLPTAVHWHGMELESFYDGVAGWSGAGARTAPILAPGDSFVVRMTPPRAGTFMYHTHASERDQLMGGLYGPLLVLPRGVARDSTERLLVFADSAVPDFSRTPPSLVNGSTRPAPIELTAGTTHRLRLIGIGAVSTRMIRLMRDTVLLTWTPLAKDGADLPRERRQPRRAELQLNAGETFDMLFTPADTGTLTLAMQSFYRAPITTLVTVRVRPRR